MTHQHQLICDKCKVKFPCSMSAIGVSMFTKKHDGHNWGGMRIEQNKSVKLRRSKDYKEESP